MAFQVVAVGNLRPELAIQTLSPDLFEYSRLRHAAAVVSQYPYSTHAFGGGKSVVSR